MARKERKERVRHRRMKIARHRIERTAPHSILATMVGAAAGVIPFVTGDPYTNDSTVLSSIGQIMDEAQAGNYGSMTYYSQIATQNFIYGVINQLPALIALGAVAGGIGWAGRKYAKSSTNISRKWRVF